MSYRIINDILDTQLATVVDIPPISKENEPVIRTGIDTDAVHKSSYIRTTLLPAETETVTIGLTGYDRFIGLYQIDIFMPEGDGAAGSNWIVDEIIKAFPKRTLITTDNITVQILNYSKSPAILTTQLYMTPLLLEWQSQINRV